MQTKNVERLCFGYFEAYMIELNCDRDKDGQQRKGNRHAPAALHLDRRGMPPEHDCQGLARE